MSRAKPKAKIKTPFPYFGNKRRVCSVVWSRLGEVDCYIEPFAGSASMLFGCPYGPRRREVIGDKDGLVANFWRAVKYAPEEVAEHVDWPSIEADLRARNAYLWKIRQSGQLVQSLEADPMYYDAQLAGWWAFVLCAWYGSEATACPAGGTLKDEKQGLLRLREDGRERVVEYLRRLARRLSNVFILCADWERTIRLGLSPSRLSKQHVVGVFLDPPYAVSTGRDKGCYAVDKLDDSVSHAVREWCKKNETLRVALCGLEGEHNELEKRGWEVYTWSNSGGFHGQGETGATQRRHAERIWFSPACLKEESLW